MVNWCLSRSSFQSLLCGVLLEIGGGQKMPPDPERLQLVKKNLPSVLHDGFLPAESSNFQLIAF